MALLPVGGRPAVFHMLGQLFSRGLERVTIVTTPQHRAVLEHTVEGSLANAPLAVDFVEQHTAKGPGHALSLVAPLLSGPVVVLLADTLCEIPHQLPEDWVGVADVEAVSRSAYCMVRADGDGIATTLTDKPVHPAEGRAAVGIYGFGSIEALCRAMSPSELRRSPRTNEIELSHIIDQYRTVKPMRAISVEGWRDLGTLRSYSKAVRESLPGRRDTQLTVTANGWITKRSLSSEETIADEAAWFSNVPDAIHALVPRKVGDADESYEIEYMDYPTLGELFTFGGVTTEDWPAVIGDLVAVLAESLWAENRPVPDMEQRCRAMYLDKTLKRLHEWDRTDLLTLDAYECNGVAVPGFQDLWDLIEPAIEDICVGSAPHSSLIHGDLCFSNILLSPHARLFRLIDPRGWFGERDAVGDRRYEAAKLRQCYHGLYDLIIADLFSIEEPRPGTFELNLFPARQADPAALDAIVSVASGVDIREVQLIEGLLFLSMLPLHADAPRRQLAFFVKALECLAPWWAPRVPLA